MTDNEIIKALECCGRESCLSCPYRDGKCHQGNPMIRDARDLINRQKVEIEQLKEEANRYQNLYCMAVDDIETAKSEAIREFAERLKKKVYPFPCAVGVEYAVTVRAMDDLVTNMIGE